MKTILVILALFLVAACATEITTETVEKGLGQNQDIAPHDEVDVLALPFEEVSDAEKLAFDAALDDEYKARATYAQVIADFGSVKPFSNIIMSEERHIEELLSLYEKYDLAAPADARAGTIPSFESITAACQGGVDAEIANAGLYDSLFTDVDNEDITAVFTSLRDASELKHKVAFERCVARGGY